MITEEQLSKYPYDIADKIIHEIYKDEFSNGGYQIDMVDVGELHFLFR